MVTNKQCGQNANVVKQSLIATIQHKMQSLGYEYGISDDNKTISLFIKLEKSRVLKTWFLYSNSTECILNRIDSIGKIAKAVNGINEYTKFGREKSPSYCNFKLLQRIVGNYRQNSLGTRPVSNLIRQKMESLGVEYRVESWSDCSIEFYNSHRSVFTLHIKLKNKIMMRTTFFYNSLEEERQQLETIEDAVKKLNDIHGNFTIIRLEEYLMNKALIIDEFDEQKNFHTAIEECWKEFSSKYPSIVRPVFNIQKLRMSLGICYGNSISLSDSLIYCSNKLQKHVIFHELSHLIQMNHSRAFYDVLGQFVPLPNPINHKIEGVYQSSL